MTRKTRVLGNGNLIRNVKKITPKTRVLGHTDQNKFRKCQNFQLHKKRRLKKKISKKLVSEKQDTKNINQNQHIKSRQSESDSDFATGKVNRIEKRKIS